MCLACPVLSLSCTLKANNVGGGGRTPKRCNSERHHGCTTLIQRGRLSASCRHFGLLFLHCLANSRSDRGKNIQVCIYGCGTKDPAVLKLTEKLLLPSVGTRWSLGKYRTVQRPCKSSLQPPSTAPSSRSVPPGRGEEVPSSPARAELPQRPALPPTPSASTPWRQPHAPLLLLMRPFNLALGDERIRLSVTYNEWLRIPWVIVLIHPVTFVIPRISIL